MNGILYFAGGFLMGGALCSALTLSFVKKTYSDKAKKAIDEVVEYYRGKSVKPVECDSDVTEVSASEELCETVAESNELEVIPCDDYNYISGYELETFVLYGDGVLTNDSDIPFSAAQIEKLFGLDIFDQICQCADNSVYVRNPMDRIDYEIIICPTEFNG